MARRPQTKAACAYCDKVLAKSGMTKHLATCAKRKEAIAQANESKKKKQTIYHLRIQDAYSSDFWLNVEVPASSKLADLDNYLRGIWLECCGHLSDFFIGGAFSREVAMSKPLSQVFSTTDAITHVYDFGTSSETLVKLVDQRTGQSTTTRPVALMARNQMPEAKCIECDEPATYLCHECMYEDGIFGTLCEKHAETHPHDDYGDPVPLYNSPRMGMCGYSGPAEPPY